MVITSGITVDAKSHSVFDTVPTYGSTPSTALELRVAVDDAEVKKQFDYDGFEKPFAMVPHKDPGAGGKVVWDRVELQYAGQSRAGYFGEKAIDEYRLPNWLKIDAETVKAFGVAIGMDTNRGQVWSQEAGHNHEVVDWK